MQPDKDLLKQFSQNTLNNQIDEDEDSSEDEDYVCDKESGEETGRFGLAKKVWKKYEIIFWNCCFIKDGSNSSSSESNDSSDEETKTLSEESEPEKPTTSGLNGGSQQSSKNISKLYQLFKS